MEELSLPLHACVCAASLIVKLRSESGPVWTSSTVFRVPHKTFILSASVSPIRTFVCTLNVAAVHTPQQLLLTLSEPINIHNAIPK